MTALPEVLCSQVHHVHPLQCRDVQLFHFQHHSDGKNTSGGERKTTDTEIHRFTRLLSHPKSIKRGTGRGKRRRNGQKLREGEADRHRVTIVMSKWSDTRERGRQTETSRETDRLGRRERNLCETCHNKVTSEKHRGRETKRHRDTATRIQQWRQRNMDRYM